eukprot:TRINITY_DN10230_c0_g1_i1.p1 TRINITY_DN10230_c0_g1~~TRINITY_DN10230_c0_g1_i1.p1  ORF type:complete len:247 (+),score=28.14 TRINITY_DN10230_c0_g1_i1:128-868(+)
MAGLLLYVQSDRHDGAPQCVEVRPDGTGADVLAGLVDCPSGAQLLWQGTMVKLTDLLSDIGVTPESTLHLRTIRPEMKWEAHHQSWELDETGKVITKTGGGGTWGARGPSLGPGQTSVEFVIRHHGQSALHTLLGVCNDSWQPSEQDPCDRKMSWCVFTREARLQHGTLPAEYRDWGLRKAKMGDVVRMTVNIPVDQSSTATVDFELNGERAPVGFDNIPVTGSLYPFCETYACEGTCIELRWPES